MDILKLVNRRLVAIDKAAWGARLLLAAMFAESVITHLLNYALVLEDVAKTGIPMPSLLFPASLSAEILGVIALITGWRYRLGILALIGFTFVSTILFFPFWSTQGADTIIFRQQFFKNFALIGCLLLLHSLGRKPLYGDR